MKHNSKILCINGFPKWFSQIYQTFQSMKVYKWENHQLDCNHLLRVTYVTICHLSSVTPDQWASTAEVDLSHVSMTLPLSLGRNLRRGGLASR